MVIITATKAGLSQETSVPVSSYQDALAALELAGYVINQVTAEAGEIERHQLLQKLSDMVPDLTDLRAMISDLRELQRALPKIRTLK